MAYVLSAADIKVLKDLLEKDKRNPVPARRYDPSSVAQAPEVYLVRTPHDGIPALVEEPGTASFEENDQPGSAECVIYELVVDNTSNLATLESLPSTETVYNSSTSVIPGDSWVLAIRDKSGTWWAMTSSAVSGRTTCKSFYDPCTGKQESMWFEAGRLLDRTDPCPECKEAPEGTGTGTGTSPALVPTIDLQCPGMAKITVPTELCLAMGAASGVTIVPGNVSYIGCPTTFSKLVRLVLQPESTITSLVYRGQVVAPPGSQESGINDISPSGVPYNQACKAEFTLTISCYGAAVQANLKGILAWRHLDDQGFDSGILGGGTSTPTDGIWIMPSIDPSTWGVNTNLFFTQPSIIAGNINAFRVTAGPCVPCPNPPFVQYSNYSITGTTANVVIQGTFPGATLANTEVEFNLGAEGVVTAINADKTRLDVTFTTRPTSTGALTVVVTVDGCCNSGPGHTASEGAVEPSGSCIDVIDVLLAAPPFDFTCSGTGLTDGDMDYWLNGDYTDHNGFGPNLVNIGGSFSGSSFAYSNDEGLSITDPPVTNPGTYTLEMLYTTAPVGPSPVQNGGYPFYWDSSSDGVAYTCARYPSNLTQINTYGWDSIVVPSVDSAPEAQMHILVTRLAGTKECILYINGVNQGNFTDSTDKFLLSGIIYFFDDPNPATGTMQRIRVYDRVLDATEVAAAYASSGTEV